MYYKDFFCAYTIRNFCNILIRLSTPIYLNENIRHKKGVWLINNLSLKALNREKFMIWIWLQ